MVCPLPDNTQLLPKYNWAISGKAEMIMINMMYQIILIQTCYCQSSRFLGQLNGSETASLCHVATHLNSSKINNLFTY